MRTAFLSELCNIAESDPRIWLLTGDLGFSVLEPFAQRFPERFINVGVAEQNMIGVAAGLAMSGNVVFTYSIGNFATLRCLEQIRLDVCYHNANVKVVAVGAGYSYASLGYSHHAVEDIGIMRTMPNLAVASPADPAEARWITRAAVDHYGPMYLRIGKAGEPDLHVGNIAASFGSGLSVRDGEDLTFVATGNALGLAISAADQLTQDGVSCAIVSIPFVKPFDEQLLLAAARKTGRIIVVEEHGVGGLSSVVCEALLEEGVPARFASHHVVDTVQSLAGTHEEYRRRAGLSVESLVDTARKMVGIGAIA